MSLEADVVFDVVDLLGVLTNGILGGVVARQLRMDLVGFTVLAILSGLGGGILRDTLLQQGFPVALTNPAYLTSSLVGAVLAYLMVFGSTWTSSVPSSSRTASRWAAGPRRARSRPSGPVSRGRPPSCWALSPRWAAA